MAVGWGDGGEGEDVIYIGEGVEGGGVEGREEGGGDGVGNGRDVISAERWPGEGKVNGLVEGVEDSEDE